MQDDHKKNMEELKMKLWAEVAVAVARSSNSTHKQFMVEWADYAVEVFETRFKPKLHE